MIFIIYLVLAATVVLLSNKAAQYVDLLEKKTRLSGAFLGGVMLSAVTSLPELFTSLSATIMLHKPGLCMGNILGSDIFNLAVLAILVLFAFKPLQNAYISKSHTMVTLIVCIIYLVLALNMFGILTLEILTISVTSIIILLLYVFAIKRMSADNEEVLPYEIEEKAEKIIPVTLKQLVIRFILVSVGIIIVSIVITYVTDIISIKLNLGQGLAGAILLGIATSLPEVSSTISLFKIKNYNIATGNIIGSNLFNFMILTIADLFYLGGGLYDFSDPKTVNLLVFGFIGTASMLVLLKFKNKITQIICPLCTVGCYVAFLLV